MSLKTHVFLGLSLFCGAVFAAPDYARETRIVNQIADAIMDGEIVQLNDGERDFMGIFTENQADQRKGAVLVLHGKGANADWMDVVQPLRVRLTEAGWDTLSLQLPVESAEAPDSAWLPLVEPAAARIAAGIVELETRGHDRIMVVSHSFGSRMAAHYLAQGAPGTVKGYVSVGMSLDMKNPNDANLSNLSKIDLPMLDLFGSRDLPGVLQSNALRAKAASHNKGYSQQEVAKADHFFAGQSDDLLAAVNAWLDAQP